MIKQKYIQPKSNIFRKYKVLVIFVYLIMGDVCAESKMETHAQPFSVKLGATRIIYNTDSSGATVSVTNPQDYPILLQSEIYNEDAKTKAPFIVTPPLFRLDGQQRSRLRIVRTGVDVIGDRESLRWLCVKGIPPKPDDEWAKDENNKSGAPKNVSVNVQIVMSTCIKLLERPSTIKGSPAEVADSISWEKNGSNLKATNPTPFYMNLSLLKVGGMNIKNTSFIAPFSSRVFALPDGVRGDLEWAVITDYGGESRTFRGNAK